MLARMQPRGSQRPIMGSHSSDVDYQGCKTVRIQNSATRMEKKRRHIALVGFMGAGKSTAGQILAERLGLVFLDLDEEIARHAGKPISEIFRDNGEVAFRAKERAALRNVLQNTSPLVLATGGGTFVDSIMHDLLVKNTRTVYLKTDMPTILQRVSSPAEREIRPLLQGPTPEKAIERLLNERCPYYQKAEFVVETSNHDPSAVVQGILEAMGLHRSPRQQVRAAEREPNTDLSEDWPNLPTIKSTAEGLSLCVKSSNGPYSVYFREHAGPWIAEGIGQIAKTNRVVVLSDSNVAQLHSHDLLSHLKSHGILAELLEFDPGEQSKTLGTASRLFDQLLDIGLTRNDCLVALGGGVVGDITGFVASTFLRGVDYIQVPTTTLAAVDSSVGGKTAVNTPRGKNLIGTFHAPKGVFVALSHLATQNKHEHAAGLVEALKMAATLDSPLFNLISKQSPALLTYKAPPLLRVLAKSIQLKAQIVEQDEHERGVRGVLNFGHTVGHAIEKGENFDILHGQAVALGMVAETQWAENSGRTHGISAPLCTALEHLGISSQWERTRIDIESLQLDKKRTQEGSSINIPIISSIGQFTMQTVSISSISQFVKGRISS